MPASHGHAAPCHAVSFLLYSSPYIHLTLTFPVVIAARSRLFPHGDNVAATGPDSRLLKTNSKRKAQELR